MSSFQIARKRGLPANKYKITDSKSNSCHAYLVGFDSDFFYSLVNLLRTNAILRQNFANLFAISQVHSFACRCLSIESNACLHKSTSIQIVFDLKLFQKYLEFIAFQPRSVSERPFQFKLVAVDLIVRNEIIRCWF